MPYSGKSRLGELLSKALDKELVDIDRKLEEKGLGINSLLLKEGLDSFRKAEAIETIHYAGKWNQIIACGGGIVLSQEAMEHLQNNGLILFLDVNQERLASRIDGTRPLIKSRQDLFRTYQERIKLYRNYADLIIGEEEEITEIKVKINEYLCD
jgi:shikimate kinase